MRSVLGRRPVDLPVQTVVELQAGAEARAVGAAILASDVEGVLQVVQVAQVDVAVDGVRAVPLHADVLDLGPTHPFEADGPPAHREGLGHDGHQGCVGDPPTAVDLDDQTEDVRALHGVRRVLPERHLPGGDRLEDRLDLKDERIGRQPGERPDTLTFTAASVVHCHRDGGAGRRRARALLRERRPRATPVARRRCSRRRAPRRARPRRSAPAPRCPRWMPAVDEGGRGRRRRRAPSGPPAGIRSSPEPDARAGAGCRMYSTAVIWCSMKSKTPGSASPFSGQPSMCWKIMSKAAALCSAKASM
jgi:hypothetical protein